MPAHDTPTLEQRLAFLESQLAGFESEFLALKNIVKDNRERLDQLRPKGPGNCKKCGRRLLVKQGAACPVCGQIQ